MKRIISVALFVLFFAHAGTAQDYQTGIGIRGGVFSGITFKQFISSYDAFEIVGAFYKDGLFLAGQYQRHARAFDVPGLNWYYGGGGHIGFYDSRIGVNGVVGIEYKIDEIPISIGLDLIPTLDIIQVTHFWMGGGVTVRYVF